MRKVTVCCDICGRETNEALWDMCAKPLRVIIETPCTNPLAALTGEFQKADLNLPETCEACRRYVAQAVLEAIQKRQPIKSA